MKKNMFLSYVAGITDLNKGEAYATIAKYFIPEFISAFLLYSMPQLVDSFFISQLSSTVTFATLGATNTLMHFLLKIAEAFSVGTVVLTGHYNGRGLFRQAGNTARDAFWLTTIVGFMSALFLYVFAYSIYWWTGVSGEIISLGIPFIRCRAIGIFFTFIYMAFVGFLRGIKNSKIPMVISMVGSVFFVLFDYLFIFGHWGFPTLGLLGSALATIIQYVVMLTLIGSYLIFNKKNKKYQLSLFTPLQDFSYIKRLMILIAPVAVDKATLSGAYIWLMMMVAPLGTKTIASYALIKDMERFAFLPAIAFAQVITFLVSNDFAIGNWDAIKTNIKKTGFLASTMVGIILFFISLFRSPIVHWFDTQNQYSALAIQALPILSGLVFFDIAQLILSGALRGSGNVRLVMMVRLLVCVGYFMPISFLLVKLPIVDEFVRFILIYGSFYIGNGLMSIVYINKLRGEEWKVSTLQGTV